jgi:hypothetical protein
MTIKTNSRRIIARLVVAGLALALGNTQAASPSILITNLPAYGATGNLSGLVLNANPATNRVAVCIFVAGAWYSKPSCASQLTTIQPDGSWTANVTPSSNDKTATKIAAFLVPANYNQCVNGATGLPIPPTATAVVYANRTPPSTRQFYFSDYNWWVRTTGGNTSGPGPNIFSDSTNNVWVDAQGLLHMKITHANNAWQCAEIISDRSFGYGQYRFTVSAPVNSLDPNVVFALFTYSDDSAYNYREIDIEMSRWSNASDPNAAQFAIQPVGAGQLQRYAVPTGVTNSTHGFIWQSNNVAFQALNGNFAAPPAATNLLKSWTCTTGIPPAGGEQIHINLWLVQGNPPINGQPVEVIISNFTFVPLGSPQPAKVNQLTRLPGGNVRLDVQGTADWHYQMLSSSNLLAWLDIGTMLATNNLFQFTDTNPAAPDARYYRALTKQ